MSDQPTQNQTLPAVPPIPQDKLKSTQDKLKSENENNIKSVDSPTKTEEFKKPIEHEQKPAQAPIQNQSEIKTPAQNSLTSENPIPVPPIVKTPTPVAAPTPTKPPINQQTPVSNQQNKNIIKTLLKKAREHIQKRRQKRLNKILIALKEKNKLSNREIKKIVRVSEATITRYMDILEKQGKVNQVGKEGRSVYYELK